MILRIGDTPRFTLRTRDEKGMVDISGVEQINLDVIRPNGEMTHESPDGFITDGKDGEFYFDVPPGWIDQAGEWRIVVRLRWADGKQFSWKDDSRFTVRPAAGQKTITPVPEFSQGLPAVAYLGSRTYWIENSSAFVVSEREDCVLQSFLEMPALDLRGLAERSGLAAADLPKIVGNLRRKYGRALAPALIPPGGKGKGGYRAIVQDARHLQQQ